MGERVKTAGRVQSEIPHRTVAAPIVRQQTAAEVKLETLERVVRAYPLAQSRAGHGTELARRRAALLAEDMSAAEKDAVWVLLLYAKRRQHGAAEEERASGR